MASQSGNVPAAMPICMHEQTDGQVKNNAAATISWCPFYGSREAQLSKRCYCMLHCPVLHWPLSGTTCVSQYQKGKPVWIQMRQETTGFWDGSGISWTKCKQSQSALRSRQITTLSLNFYRPDNSVKAQKASTLSDNSICTCVLLKELA